MHCSLSVSLDATSNFSVISTLANRYPLSNIFTRSLDLIYSGGSSLQVVEEIAIICLCFGTVLLTESPRVGAGWRQAGLW